MHATHFDRCKCHCMICAERTQTLDWVGLREQSLCSRSSAAHAAVALQTTQLQVPQKPHLPTWPHTIVPLAIRDEPPPRRPRLPHPHSEASLHGHPRRDTGHMHAVRTQAAVLPHLRGISRGFCRMWSNRAFSSQWRRCCQRPVSELVDDGDMRAGGRIQGWHCVRWHGRIRSGVVRSCLGGPLTAWVKYPYPSREPVWPVGACAGRFGGWLHACRSDAGCVAVLLACVCVLTGRPPFI